MFSGSGGAEVTISVSLIFVKLGSDEDILLYLKKRDIHKLDKHL